jgi:hypothetical protein
VHLVEHQQGWADGSQAAPQGPLLFHPAGVGSGGQVGRGVVGPAAEVHHGLPSECRLADLARAGQDLQEAPRVGQAAAQFGALGAVYGARHAAECIIYSSW